MTTKSATEMLTECGEALFGADWRSPLAEALGINLRTVQRWSSGAGEPGPGVFRDIEGLLKRRRVELAQLAAAALETADYLEKNRG